MTAPVEVRADLARALELDLVGPTTGDDLAAEVLDQAPSRWYLTGFLVPLGADVAQKSDETAAEEVDEAEAGGVADDTEPPEPRAARRAFFPSSMGVSVLIPESAQGMEVTVRWGDYRRDPAAESGETTSEDGIGADVPQDSHGRPRWRRTQHEASVSLALSRGPKLPDAPLPESGGMVVVATVRPVGDAASVEDGVPRGTRSVAVFVVNRRAPAEDEVRDEAFAFQVELEVACKDALVARPDLRGLRSEDWDERIADLQYRDSFEYAVGHGAAIDAEVETDGSCRVVRTKWIPRAEVQRVAPEPIPGVELSMEALASLADGDEARIRIGTLGTSYRAWIDDQRASLIALSARRRETAEELLRRAGIAATRIDEGVAILADPLVIDAFRIANRTMAEAARRREAILRGVRPSDVDAPAWRPFQLAFILMNLSGIHEPTINDREVVDLLFFPTGGGKTEAYLGLAAFTLALRRLKDPTLTSSGMSVLMRYTLRLLTLDQLSRAAALVCALELERQGDPTRLGTWPFEIGLWVGQAATPNRMGSASDPKDQYSARRRTLDFKRDTSKPSPIPLEDCPWCGTKFNANSFNLVPNPDQPLDLRVRCADRDCEFAGERSLPILAVDEPIYRRLPCFLIATVDKFAAMPWTGRVGALFGRVDRADADGFYGPCDAGRGAALSGPLAPPDLVIQDELHLISGPMGTMVGLYETALDALSSRRVNGHLVRPKVVASTATVRHAERQIRALFARRVVEVFPPPGPDRRDSLFAQSIAPSESNARLYLGIAAQGRSEKVVLLRTYLALLGAGQRAYETSKEAADPYMTLVGYFNSLRLLGGSRRIVEDEVATRLAGYSRRRRVDETEGLFADRAIAYEVVELTSRVGTNKVAEAKHRLALGFQNKERVDVALATNMISVGLDITRLGLMVVFGQPKTSAEYIQATSRVGRDAERPGLVVTLLNLHKPRDRSHYERFAAYHQSFYRAVEATGVTPFSPRALDRGLAGALVALARLGHDPLTPPRGAEEIQAERNRLAFVTDDFVERAREHARLSGAETDALAQRVRARSEDLLDEWAQIARDYHDKNTQLQYQEEVNGPQRLLYDFLDPALSTLPARHMKFRAARSMRDVEPEVNLWLKTLDKSDLPQDDA